MFRLTLVIAVASVGCSSSTATPATPASGFAADAGPAPPPPPPAADAMAPPPADAGAADASPADASPPPQVFDWNRCQRDEDCVLTRFSCSACGSCPGPDSAMSKKYLDKISRECERERRRRERELRKPGGKKPIDRPRCSPCRSYTGEEMAKWPTEAICDRGACVAAGRRGSSSIEAEIDAFFGGQ